MRLSFAACILAIGWSNAAQESRESHLTQARSAEVSGRFAEAETAYQRALAIRADPETWQRLGLVRYMQNKFESATAALEKAVAGNPDLWGSHLFLGISYYRTNQFSRALLSLQSADKLKPDQGETLFWLGAALIATNDRMGGLAALERARVHEPKNPEILRLLAQNYLEGGTSLWNRVAEEFPDSPAGLEVHGNALEFNGNFAEAAQSYQDALSLEPARRGVRLSMARALIAAGKGEEAVAAIQQELERAPGSTEACRLLATAAENLRRPIAHPSCRN